MTSRACAFTWFDGDCGPRTTHLLHGRRVHARQATIVCAGAWAGQLLDRALSCSTYTQLITPLRGHLLHVPAAAVSGVKLAHGIMETAYCAVSHCCKRNKAAPHCCSSPAQLLLWWLN